MYLTFAIQRDHLGCPFHYQHSYQGAGMPLYFENEIIDVGIPDT